MGASQWATTSEPYHEVSPSFLKSEDANSADEDIVFPLSCPIHYARLQRTKWGCVIRAI